MTHIDFMVSIIAFVKLEDSGEALKFFAKWKKKLEKQLQEDIILIYYHSISIMGDVSSM